eukprot:COSAG05_NODE_949_length_6474_cov_7.735216_1_plen_53_part_00
MVLKAQLWMQEGLRREGPGMHAERAAIGRWACEKWVSQVRFWVSQQKVKIAA